MNNEKEEMTLKKAQRIVHRLNTILLKQQLTYDEAFIITDLLKQTIRQNKAEEIAKQRTRNVQSHYLMDE